MRKCFIFFLVVFVLSLSIVPAFAASFNGSYTFYSSDGKESVHDIIFADRCYYRDDGVFNATDGISFSYDSTQAFPVVPGQYVVFPNGLPESSEPGNNFAGVTFAGSVVPNDPFKLDSSSFVARYSYIDHIQPAGTFVVVPEGANYMTVTWYNGRNSSTGQSHILPVFSVREVFRSGFFDSVTNAVSSVPNWMGQILGFFVQSPLLGLFGIGIAISLILLIFVVLRRSSSGF